MHVVTNVLWVLEGDEAMLRVRLPADMTRGKSVCLPSPFCSHETVTDVKDPNPLSMIQFSSSS